MSIPIAPDLSFSDSREDFAQIIQRYQNLVYAVIFSIVGNPQQSEDIAQETFLVAWKNYGNLHEESKLSAWLCGIARNLSRKWLRDHFTTTDTVSLSESLPQPEPQSDENSHREKAAQLVWDSLKLLAEKYREPLVMFYQNQASIRDIADALEISEDAVKQRLSRGRKQLKEIVEQQFSDALEVIRPGKTFSLAVLAAIPLAVQTTEVMATTGAVLLGSTTSTSTASPTSGTPILFGLTGQAIGFLVNLLFWVAFYIGLFFGIAGTMQNAPTLRSRRFMIQVVLVHYLVLFLVLVFEVSLIQGQVVHLRNSEMLQLTLDIICVASALFLVGYTATTSWFFNRRWRQIVEEDTGIQAALDVELEKSHLSRRNLLMQIVGTFGVILLFYSFRIYHGISDGAYEKLFVLLPHAVLALIIVYFFRSTKDEATFQKYPSKCPDLLDRLTGKNPSRKRFSFFLDTIVLMVLCCPWLLFIMAEAHENSVSNTFYKYFISQQPIHWNVANVLQFALIFAAIIAFLWQAIRFVGIPGKRYHGFVIFGALQGVFFFTAFLIAMMAADFSSHRPGFVFASYGPLLLGASFYVTMFLSGLIGLRVFAKN